jgi:hypothetical protein
MLYHGAKLLMRRGEGSRTVLLKAGIGGIGVVATTSLLHSIHARNQVTQDVITYGAGSRRIEACTAYRNLRAVREYLHILTNVRTYIGPLCLGDPTVEKIKTARGTKGCYHLIALGTLARYKSAWCC